MANGILVLIEHNENKISRMAWEAVAGAQKIGVELKLPVSVAVAGKGIDGLAQAVAKRKVEKVYVVDDGKLANYTPDGYMAALAQVIKKASPKYIFAGHSYQARDYLPKLATKLDGNMLTDCIGYSVDGNELMLKRQVFAGKFNADYSFSGDGPLFVSFQAGAFSADEVKDGSATIEKVDAGLGSVDIRTKVLDIFQGVKQEVDLSKAEVIVSAGRGLKEKDNMQLVQELAKALGGEVSGSRPVCDDGWLNIDRQIGSSGQTVAPKLYLAIGISGAIQHVVGMKSSKFIVAINKDPDAPIFELSDVAVVADLFEVIPELTKAINAAK